MNNIYIFLIRNDIWIYILCAFGILWYLSTLWRARGILQQAMFGLEREKGQRMQNNAMIFIVLLTTLSGVVAYVNLQIAPGLPPEMLRPPTPTPNLFVTPLYSPTPLGSPMPDPPSPTPPVVATVTLRNPDTLPTPPGVNSSTGGQATAVSTTGTPPSVVTTPTPPQSQAPPASGCSTLINITQPAQGDTVSGAISIFGSARNENFAFYKLEANGPETNGLWASIIGGTIDNPVDNALLGTANMGAWTAGTYAFRLTVVDVTSNEVGHCTIQITLAN